LDRREYIEKGSDVNAIFDRMITEVQSCVESATRIHKKKKGDEKSFKARQPWITGALVKLTVEKSAAYQNYRRDRENRDLYQKFRNISAIVKREVRKAKTEYYSKMLDDNARDAKKYWQIVNRIRKPKRDEEIQEITVDGKKCTANKDLPEMVDAFNKYYNMLPEKLLQEKGLVAVTDAEYDINSERLADENTAQQCLGGLCSLNLNSDDVERAINSLKNKRYTAHGGINAVSMKRNAKFFANKLVKLLIQLLVSTGPISHSLEKSNTQTSI
jgi:hypothetical protein